MQVSESKVWSSCSADAPGQQDTLAPADEMSGFAFPCPFVPFVTQLIGLCLPMLDYSGFSLADRFHCSVLGTFSQAYLEVTLSWLSG